jgi:hypothetical protein
LAREKREREGMIGKRKKRGERRKRRGEKRKSKERKK